MGRLLLLWWEDSATVNNELETADHAYREQLLEILPSLRSQLTSRRGERARRHNVARRVFPGNTVFEVGYSALA